MVLSLLAIPAGLAFGVGVCAYLAYNDTKRGVHPNTMGGPKQRARLLRSYMLLGVLGLVGWIAVSEIASSWLATLLGFACAFIGRSIFNRLDRRMTRYIG